jgi:capsid protein
MLGLPLGSDRLGQEQRSMLQYLLDKWRTVSLQAQTERLLQERLLQQLEGRAAQPVEHDVRGWMPLDTYRTLRSPAARLELLQRARQLVQTNPYARNMLRLLEIYVAGPGLNVTAVASDPDRVDVRLSRRVDRLWRQFLFANRNHFSLRETARRTWRDGECFLQLVAQPAWPPTVRYIDPEGIGPVADVPSIEGLVTDPEDVESVRSYLHIDPGTATLLAEIPAEQMLHLRHGVDSNEPRGTSMLAPVLDSLAAFESWLDTELQARQLQSSIVLWRRVQGSPGQATALADQASSARPATWGSRQERYQPGSIVTTSQGTDLQFLQPNTHFSDAVPLGRLLLLGVAAGAGLPEFMLAADASNSNYASTMVAEGPAVKLFESEQQFFAERLERLWWWVIEQAMATGQLPQRAAHRFEPQWTFPQLVNRDRSAERRTDAALVSAGILSRAEVARRENVDPLAMQAELDNERRHQGDQTATSPTVPDSES